MENVQEKSKRNKPQGQRVYIVEDLREKLNKKREEREKEQSTSGPPPDPSYNFLKDPERDGDDHESSNRQRRKEYGQGSSRHYNKGNQYNKSFNQSYGHQKYENYKNYRKPNYFSKDHTKDEDDKPIYNIKVELTAATGKRSYMVDETNPLPPITVTEDTHHKNFQHKSTYNSMSNRNFYNPNKQYHSGNNYKRDNYGKYDNDEFDDGYIKTKNFYPKRGNNDKFRGSRGTRYNNYRGKQQSNSYRRYDKDRNICEWEKNDKLVDKTNDNNAEDSSSQKDVAGWDSNEETNEAKTVDDKNEIDVGKATKSKDEAEENIDINKCPNVLPLVNEEGINKSHKIRDTVSNEEIKEVKKVLENITLNETIKDANTVETVEKSDKVKFQETKQNVKEIETVVENITPEMEANQNVKQSEAIVEKSEKADKSKISEVEENRNSTTEMKDTTNDNEK